MKLLHAAVLAALSLGLTSCVVSEQKYVEYRTIIKKRPDIQARLINECAHKASALGKDKQALMAELFDVKQSTFPQSFCRRILRSYLSGRLTYQDYRDMDRGKPTTRLIRIMRGK